MSPQPPIVTADIYDAYHQRLEVCELAFRNFGKRTSFFGPCATVKTFEDHLPVLEVLKTQGGGRVLIVDAGGALRVGVMGDRVADVGMKSGWAGAVIFGAIRDSAGIDQLEFGVKALGATARRTWIHGTGHRDVPLQFGGARFTPGSWVYADNDSVIISSDELDLSRVTS